MPKPPIVTHSKKFLVVVIRENTPDPKFPEDIWVQDSCGDIADALRVRSILRDNPDFQGSNFANLQILTETSVIIHEIVDI